MIERRPLFGRIIEVLQDRYTANRLAQGTATEYSISEFALSYLKSRGLRGIPSALKEIKMMNIAQAEQYRDEGMYYWGNTGTMFAINVVAFFWVVLGFKLPIDKDSNKFYGSP